ncbi:MAG: class I SAM-dependent methyltransferase [Chromatiales bacterium]|nr:class I SAM-dependent methyltransferase [Chromatiales bacterium]
MSALGRFLSAGLTDDALHMRTPDGAVETIGRGSTTLEWVFHDARTPARILRNPGLNLGETYMEGQWDVSGGSLLELLRVLFVAVPDRRSFWVRAFARTESVLQSLNRIARSYRNVAHHYDLDESLFRLFLDTDMHYSCAYFPRPGMDLDAAQQAKCTHIARKLCLSAGQRVLDIGSGWGGMAMHLAREHAVEVTGITLSKEQLRVSRERVTAAGLGDRVRFELCDYREHRGRYDRVVSIGMFEHVGLAHFQRFFQAAANLVSDDGAMLLHTIGSSGPPSPTNAWIARHIFPGGYIPALSETSRAIERAGWVQTDIETLRLHYADTLKAWHERFQRQRARFVERLGERFCRMWEFYLQASEASFRWRDLVVFQLQLAKRHGAIPITREYMYRP